MVTYFLTGVIIGVLLGLILAPVLRSWLLWQQAKAWDERDRNRSTHPTEHVH